jgi:hypothetical protein
MRKTRWKISHLGRLIGACLALSAVAALEPALAAVEPSTALEPPHKLESVLPLAPALTPPPPPKTLATTPPQSTFTIQSSDGILQIAQKERKEWYQEGAWPLIGAGVVTLITSTIPIVLVYLQSMRSFNALLRQRKIDSLALALNDFYNPLIAIIEVNGEIFTQTGPPAFPEEYAERAAAALVWKEMRTKIVENNREIELLLKTKTHLLYKSDTLDAYKALFIHVVMYETFQKVETDRYAKFQFPKNVRSHIVAMRSAVLREFHALSGGQL